MWLAPMESTFPGRRATYSPHFPSPAPGRGEAREGEIWNPLNGFSQALFFQKVPQEFRWL